ncbi:hypothetical protein NDU88_011405 [Pleurodeles waltl]|uniref:Uncharacterized protein n=1 Tax=Pleurodeles waltl TaxID=8319 RepID=A0AAV7R2Y7_PLEWA|nr:hypothetical protein NDU88_011405 [Pleurodeles waltl]
MLSARRREGDPDESRNLRLRACVERKKSRNRERTALWRSTRSVYFGDRVNPNCQRSQLRSAIGSAQKTHS